MCRRYASGIPSQALIREAVRVIISWGQPTTNKIRGVIDSSSALCMRILLPAVYEAWQNDQFKFAREMSRMEENQATGKSDSRSTVVASLAALGSVIVASSCCLPLLPFLFAAGAAGTSALAVRLRPYFALVLSVLLIAFGFYRSWRAQQCNCKPSRISTFLLWFSATVVVAFIFFPQVIANLLADLLAGKS